MNYSLIKLIASCAIICVVWLVLLPILSTQPTTAARIERLESKGIDPSAMFYTDVEIMEEISHRWKETTAKHPDALWVPDVSINQKATKQ